MSNFKKFIVMAATIAAAMPAFAQAESNAQGSEDLGNRVVMNKWYENWEVAAKIGTQAYLGEYCTTDLKFVDSWSFPAIDINISKWGTHSIGLDLGFTFSPMKTLYGATGNDAKYATFAKPDDDLYKPGFNMARGHMGNAYISVIFDLCNIFGGYKEDRFYHLVANVGGGIMFPTSKAEYKDVGASFNAGLVNKFSVTPRLSVDVAFRGTLHDDMFNGISYYTSNDRKNLSVDATIGATVGVSYRFDIPRKKSKSTTPKVSRSNEGWSTVNDVVPETKAYKEVETKAVQAEAKAEKAEAAVKEAEQELAAKTDEVKAAEAANAALVQKMSEKEDLYYKQLINFTIDKWDISNAEKVRVMFAAETIKRNPDVKFLVEGFADVQTSYAKHNLFLSEQRVNAVRDMLVNEFGVNPDQLETSHHGGVDYIFLNDEQCSRSVIITAVSK